jgi:hypothetical protein
MKKTILNLTAILFAIVSYSQTGNEVLGNNAGSNITSGDYNTIIGDSTAHYLSTSLSNTILGYRAGHNINFENTSQANYNVFIGEDAGYFNTTADENVYIGYQAGYLSTTNLDNVFVGFRAGYHNDDSDGTFIGHGAGFNNTRGGDNTFIGEAAGLSVTTGDDNTFVGQKAGAGTITSVFPTTGATTSPNTASDNTAIGSAAGFNLKTGYRNVFLGSEAGYDNETGYKNTFVGDSTGTDNNAGRLNTFVGQAAGAANEHASYNTFLGVLAGGDVNRTNKTDGSSNRNTYVGVYAGASNREGTDNVGIGAFADIRNYSSVDLNGAQGQWTIWGTSTKREFNTYVGAQAYANANEVVLLGYDTRADGNKSIAIGTGAFADDAETIVMGYRAYGNTFSDRSIGIGVRDSIQHRDAVSIGYEAKITGQYAVGLGRESVADTSSVAIGYNSKAYGKYGVALGDQSQVADLTQYAMAIGSGANATTSNSLVLGGVTTLDRVSVGIGTTAPNQNASLDLADTDKGLLVNRLTNALRTALEGNLTATDEGLIAYDTDDKALYAWDGSAWSSSTNTDVQDLELSGNTLSLTNDVSTVDLSTYMDNTDNQALTLSSNNLELTSDDGTDIIDFSGYLDNTDSQNLSLTGTTLDISGGTGVDLSGYLDNTDGQNLSLSGTTLNISGGTGVDLAPLQDGTGTDNQELSLTGTALGITGSATTIDLSLLQDGTGTDNQNLASATLSGNTLTVAIEGGTSANVDLSPILSALETENTNQQVQIDDLISRMETLEACACQTLTVTDPEDNTSRSAGPILYQNIPNPFNGTTSIKYYVPLSYKNADIVFSNTSGQIIDNVALNQLGDQELFFNSDTLASGIYYYTLYANRRKVDTKKMIIN